MSARYTGGLVYNAPGGWSGLFNGSNQYLSLPNNSALSPEGGDFTIEAWVYLSALPATYTHIYTSNSTNGVVTYISSTGTVAIGYSGNFEIAVTTAVVPLSTWTHIAFSRSGTTVRIFLNGVQSASATNSTTFTSTVVGSIGFNSGFNYFNGYLSNVRFVKGTAVYTANFTPPVGALLPITNTSLLTCRYPTFVDGSTNNFTITNNNSTLVSTVNPFPTSQLPNPALGGAGNGVYTMSQYAALKAANLWPAYDPYYKNVTLNLHGNGTNAAQNNTFLDSSTNNFTITRNGNTTQGTFTPYGANWSNYFDGSVDYLTSAYNSAFDVAGGTFTSECWINITGLFTPNTDGNRIGCIAEFGPSTTGIGWEFLVDQTGSKLTFGTPGANNRFSCSYTFAIGVFYHVAVVRNSSTNSIYVNGISQTLTENTYTGASATSGNITIGTGRRFGGYNHDYLGYISNFRLVKGSAVYSSAFTPSTTPLTAVTNTSILTCQSNRFVDNSSNNFTLTLTGTPSVQRFSPFSPTTAYSTSAIGGSGYFDGSGDYLSVASNDAFRVDQGDWTIEGWVYITSTGSNFTLANRGVYVSVYSFYCGSSGTSLYYEAGTGGWAATGYTSSSGALVAGQWNHIAYVRSGTSLYMYSNGNRVFSQVVASVGANVTAPMWVGQYLGGSAGLNGNMTDFRFVKGTAVYTGATYTVPTSPLTAITNTSLLLSYTNAGILDNAMMNDLETVGNAQLSTSVKKYGTGSMYFDGTGDALTAPSSPAYDFGSGNFTIECWVYLNANASLTDLISKTTDTSSVYGPFDISFGTSTLFLASTSGSSWAINISASALSTGVWTHIAFVRNGSTFTAYINGTSVGTGTTSSALTANSAPLIIGAGKPDGSTRSINGYIDDLRITKGVARYTTNFTPPTSQVQDQ